MDGSQGAPVPRRNFEGLFEHVLQPDGAFREALRRAGYDAADPRESYPLGVWREALRVARAHAHPQLTEAQAYRELGRQVIQGLSHTLVGRVFALAAPMLGPARCVAKMPTYLRSSREDVRVHVRALELRLWEVEVHDPDPLPEFVAGSVEAVLRLTRVLPRVEVELQSASAYVLRVSWIA
ncbi:DUF2378 family protein [Aggregicoccus sp. 17bor-14]|uniref:DUF2378 family protein n=1 Tax=Myxococcaceae TaxID=31 RepID=UPI00129C6657|nr:MULTISPECIES: DUF2378 family protein [Myxococcaceae]MBF5042567.1 DUF2378 family protein [Simulacricoccus sp. 17bor-14]MRI88336.1 DUF2378 family protein [Aggregicoccus sp. 17bor-14]